MTVSAFMVGLLLGIILSMCIASIFEDNSP